MCVSPVNIVNLILLGLQSTGQKKICMEKCIFIGIFFHKIIFLTNFFSHFSHFQFFLSKNEFSSDY